MIRQEFKDELDQRTRGIMFMTLFMFPGVVVMFPFLVGLITEIDLLTSDAGGRSIVNLGAAELPLLDWGFFLAFCLAAFVVRRKFTRVDALLSPVKPDHRLQLPHNWENAPKHGHELKAFIIHQRFVTANVVTRILLVVAGFSVFGLGTYAIHGIAIGTASILILLYFWIFLPNWSNLQEAMRQVVYQPVDPHLNPADHAEKPLYDAEEEKEIREYGQYLADKRETDGLDEAEEADFREYMDTKIRMGW